MHILCSLHVSGLAGKLYYTVENLNDVFFFLFLLFRLIELFSSLIFSFFKWNLTSMSSRKYWLFHRVTTAKVCV